MIETKQKMKTYKGQIVDLKENQIFVFGSNPQGRHGMGAAKLALEEFGAIYGKGRGFAGQSYALITKHLRPKGDLYYNGRKVKYFHEWNDVRCEELVYETYGERSVSPQWIINNIEDLYNFAKRFPNKEFLVAYGVGENLNGYSTEEMAAFFSVHPIPENMVFNEEFSKYLIER